MGCVSPPIKTYIDHLNNKNITILIPGAGNSYETEFLFNAGFKNITVLDIARQPLINLKKRIPSFPASNLIHENFFEHKKKYDLILEQTFFCSLNPELRDNYVKKMSELLNENGKIAGLLFDFPLNDEGPPFGGSIDEYQNRFSKYFTIKTMARCYNSIKPRQGSELFIIFEKKKQ
jgi:thiopurine S-methyltransferase